MSQSITVLVYRRAITSVVHELCAGTASLLWMVLQTPCVLLCSSFAAHSTCVAASILSLVRVRILQLYSARCSAEHILGAVVLTPYCKRI
jgi:hypothetical protein